jgi:hypothetical protein
VGFFGPGKAIHIVTPLGLWFAEVALKWNSSGGTGQLTVELQVQAPGTSQFVTVTAGRGPNDHHLYATRTLGSYLFKAIVRDAAGNSQFATLQANLP